MSAFIQFYTWSCTWWYCHTNPYYYNIITVKILIHMVYTVYMQRKPYTTGKVVPGIPCTHYTFFLNVLLFVSTLFPYHVRKGTSRVFACTSVGIHTILHRGLVPSRVYVVWILTIYASTSNSPRCIHPVRTYSQKRKPYRACTGHNGMPYCTMNKRLLRMCFSWYAQTAKYMRYSIHGYVYQ